MSSERISPDTAEAIEANREELDRLADSDLPAAPVGRALLNLLE